MNPNRPTPRHIIIKMAKVKEEIGSLPEKEFRVMIVKMIQNRGNRMEKIQEMLNKDPEELKNKQTEMNNTVTEMKNTLEGINSRKLRQKNG